MIDNDAKNVSHYFDSFKEEKSENDIILKQHPDFNHYIVVICPEMEAWLLKAAKSVSVNPKDFNLPDVPKELHKITGKEGLFENKNFRDFLSAIRESAPMQSLKELLRDLKMNT